MDGSQSGSPADAVKRPTFILSALNWLFAIIVFGCIADKVKVSGGCYYDLDDNACGYGIAIGVIAFIAASLFMLFEFVGDRFGALQKFLTLFTLGFSVLWTFLWFVGFCYLTDKWVKFDFKDQVESDVKNNAQAAIAFSFFSIITWAAFSFLTLKKWRLGGQAVDNSAPAPYTNYQADTGNNFAPPPFQGDQSGYAQPSTGYGQA
ncbi:hypothetical protein CAOG_08098 [Capsaspora owczarzaki ATCC 30864]|uniref:hypothetical protein n=1 Tax=Capsaspora owczarzaki (strain ATCC 30864) TaxID=595528 RepID=UPI0001FE3D18|nr:hypothetical protein CAOG_08098 [Capsaspora owczarzaki ATCC 30864]|eukprot:XP_004342699.1 hypothetical protein CAOG_08098 [Capsaspora owczarzaki ATCC 30864]